MWPSAHRYVCYWRVRTCYLVWSDQEANSNHCKEGTILLLTDFLSQEKTNWTDWGDPHVAPAVSKGCFQGSQWCHQGIWKGCRVSPLLPSGRNTFLGRGLLRRVFALGLLLCLSAPRPISGSCEWVTAEHIQSWSNVGHPWESRTPRAPGPGKSDLEKNQGSTSLGILFPELGSWWQCPKHVGLWAEAQDALRTGWTGYSESGEPLSLSPVQWLTLFV